MSQNLSAILLTLALLSSPFTIAAAVLWSAHRDWVANQRGRKEG